MFFGSNPIKPQLSEVEFVRKDIDHSTGLFSSIQSSRHSGNSVLCPRSAPSMKRFIRSPTAAPESLLENHMKHCGFTQPASKADFATSQRNVRFTPNSIHQNWAALRST